MDIVADAEVILIAAHTSIIDQHKIALEGPNYVLTYGKFGDCILTSEYANLERMFFNAQLPRSVDEFEEIIPTLPPPTSDKKFKLHRNNYHDMSITLCSYGYMTENHEQCDTEEDASYIDIYLSGTFVMGNNHINYNNVVRIDPTFYIDGSKRFMVLRRVASDIYKTSVFPDERDLDKIYSKKLKNGTIIKRNSISLNELISKTKTTLSFIISKFTANKPRIFILDGCRYYGGNNLDERNVSSASENSGSSTESEDMSGFEQSFVQITPPIQINPPIQPPIKSKPIRKNTLTKRGSRTNGKKGDSLLNLGLNPNAKGTRKRKKKRKYNRK